MNIAIAMLGYMAGAAALAGGLAGGVLFLARSGDSQTTAAPRRGAPIPPRIAESIERRKPLAQPPAEQLAVVTPVAVRPTMQESNVALTPKASTKFVIRQPPSPPKKPTKKFTPRASTAALEQGAPTAPAVTTARSDNPY